MVLDTLVKSAIHERWIVYYFSDEIKRYYLKVFVCSYKELNNSARLKY